MRWYQIAFKSYRQTIPDAPLPTKATLQQFVVALRDREVRAITCNTYIGAMNAFCAWLHDEGHVAERVKLPKLLVERRIIQLLNDTHMRVLIGYKPTSLGQRCVHLTALLILDTGLRISEALHLRHTDVDLDNLILKVFGKGQQERFVPFSPELRKRLFRFDHLKEKKRIRSEFVRRISSHAMGEAEQHDVAVFDGAETRPPDVRLAPPPAHLRDELPPPGHPLTVSA